jgi:PAS domain S-box-containing protein
MCPSHGKPLPRRNGGAPRRRSIAARARLAAIVESSDDAIIGKTLEGTITDWNGGAERLYGYRSAEAIGRHMRLLEPPERAGEMQAILARLAKGERIEHYETERVRKDGRRVSVSVTISPIRAASGAVFGASAIARDITERRAADQQRLEHTLRLEALHEIDRAILDARPVESLAAAALSALVRLVPCDVAAVLSFDEEAGMARALARHAAGDRAWPAEAAWPLAEFSPPEVFLATPTIAVDDLTSLAAPSPIVARLCAAGLRSLLTQALIAEQRLVGVVTLCAARPAAFDAAHCAASREVADQLAIAINQTALRERMRAHTAELERRVAERTAELEATNRELEAFSYSVSHDLRAPLRAIDGFSTALEEEYGATLAETGHHYLARIRGAAARMSRLIDDLLALARASQNGLRRRRVDLSARAAAIVAGLRERAPERDVTVVIAPGLTADGDPVLLDMLLQNLLGNAWKYTSTHPHARIDVGAATQDGARVFFVRDDGVGFDPEYADRLFVAFQRLHDHAVFEGTGIGLAIVARIVHRHGGQVWAEGAPERGATFYFTIPARS